MGAGGVCGCEWVEVCGWGGVTVGVGVWEAGGGGWRKACKSCSAALIWVQLLLCVERGGLGRMGSLKEGVGWLRGKGVGGKQGSFACVGWGFCCRLGGALWCHAQPPVTVQEWILCSPTEVQHRFCWEARWGAVCKVWVPTPTLGMCLCAVRMCLIMYLSLSVGFYMSGGGVVWEGVKDGGRRSLNCQQVSVQCCLSAEDLRLQVAVSHAWCCNLLLLSITGSFTGGSRPCSSSGHLHTDSSSNDDSSSGS